VLYRTEPVPEMAVVASKRADPALVEKVRKYFLEEINRKQLAVLSWLGVNGFVPADADRYAPFAKQVNEVYPPASQPDEMPVEP
jgi:ABC-type phosphate/phosphonate transport system substrate-binding protein